MRMLSLTRVSRGFSLFDRLVERRVALLYAATVLVAGAWKYSILSRYDGGWELWNAYIPKTMLLLNGQNPYAAQPWAAPYPPLMFLVLGGIVKLASLGSGPSLGPVSVVAWDLKVAGLVADLLLGTIVFYALRIQKISGLRSLLPPGVLLLSPGLALSNYFWFHGDIFGYLILGLSLLAFTMRRTLIGVCLLSMAVAFKLQPVLALLLVLVWVVRRVGLSRSLPAILSSVGILGVGLGLPLALPGYFGTIIGFNLSYGAGSGMASFTLMNLLNGSLLGLFETGFSPFQINMVWVAATMAIFIAILGFVWTRSDRLTPVEIVGIGLLAWLFPLRTLYPYYLVWALVPFLFIANVRHVLSLAVGFELLNTFANWSWGVQPDPFPQMVSAEGYLATSLIFAAWSIVGLFFLFRTVNTYSRPHSGLHCPS